MKLLGANWKTTVSGLLAVSATVISTQPNLIAFLPNSVRTWVGGVAGIIAAISAAYFVVQAKDKNVTGGTVQQTANGDVAKPATRSMSVADTATARSTWEIPEGRGL